MFARSTDVLIYGGIAIGGLVLVEVARRQLRPKLLELPHRPAEIPEAPRPLPTAPSGAPIAQNLATDPIPLAPGSRYIAAIEISGPLSLLASKSKVRGEAEKLGFTAITVTEDKPPTGRPPLPPADYYVEATFSGAPSAIARSHAGGRVRVLDAWRLA